MNVVSRFRSNYFAVRDRAAFEQWCQRLGLQLIVDDTDPHLVGLLNSSNEGGIPSTLVEEGEEEERDIDFLGELSALLAERAVAVVIEIAYEGYHYLGGVAYAVNNKGERRSIDLADIMPLAESLGDQVTRCEY